MKLKQFIFAFMAMLLCFSVSVNAQVAKVGDTEYATLQAALDAAAAGTGNVTVAILADVNLTGVDWNPVTVSAPGYPVVTVEGNGKTIIGLNDMLFAGTWAGKSGLIIKNLTIANSAIVNDKDDAKGTVGVGAFIGYPQASATITLENCHLKNSSVEGGHWTGGLIGMAGGYNGADGPVFMNLTIKGCSVTGSTITGKGSVGGVIGHGSCAAWTNVVIEETTVSDNSITSTGSSNVKAGAVMGTIGAAGQPTTVNGVTHTGGMSVSATVAANAVKSNGTEITTIYGRQGTETGMLYIAGGSYDKYPIEEGVAYAAPAKGYKIEKNTNGTYGIVEDPEYGKVAKIGNKYYATFEEAFAAVQAGETLTLLTDLNLSDILTINKSITLDGNGKTLTYTGNGTSARAIDVPANADAKVNVTIENLTVDCTASYCQRGINYNEDGKLTLEGVTVKGTNVTYALNLPGSSDNAKVAINNSSLTGNIALNVWGENSTINAENTTFTAVDNNTVEGYAAVKLNNDGTTSAEGSVITITGGKIDVTGSACTDTEATSNGTSTGKINISNSTVVNGKNAEMVAVIRYADGNSYSFMTIEDAIAKAQAGDVVTLIRDITASAQININKNVTIDGNGKKLTVNAARGFQITGGTVAISNLTIDMPNAAEGNRGVNLYNGDTNAALDVTLNNVTINGGKAYAVNIGGGKDNKLTIKNSTLTGYAAINVHTSSVNHTIVVDGSTLNGKNHNNNYSFGTVVIDGTNAHSLTITNTTITTENLEGVTSKYEKVVVGANCTLNWDGEAAVRNILADSKGGKLYYTDLQTAIKDAAEVSGTVQILGNIATTKSVVVPANKKVTLDLNGKTISQEKECTASYEMINNKGNLTITGNGKLSFKDTSAGDPNFGWGSYTVRNEGTLVVENGTIEHLGAQTFGTHCIMALFQYCGSTTINGGTISTPNYRSARLWKGDMTINGGTFDGQLWVQAVDNTAKLTINGGTFEPNGGDASAVFVTNNQYDVQFAVTDGTFNGKVGCSDATKLAGAITGGKFNETAKNGTNAALLATGFIFGEAGTDGYYEVKDDPSTLYIANLDDLKAFRDAVNNGTNYYAGVNVYLAADIDMAGENWVGIGTATKDHGFMGNFDGQGYKIKNLTINNPAPDSDGYAYAGLFGVTEGKDQNNQNTIKNLTIENVTITTDGHIAAAAVAYPYYTIIDNVKVCGDIKIQGGNYTAGVLAYTRRCVNASNLSIVGNDDSFVKGNQTVGGVISDIQMNGGLTADYKNFSAEGLTISGTKQVGGISGIISLQTLDVASVKNVTLSCSDARVGIVSGALGGPSTISNVTYENVTGATNLIGATYDNAKAVAAKIDDTYYATLEDALAAKGNEVVELLVPYVVAKGETVTLDLNGKTVTGTPSEAKAYAVITNYGTLTISNGSVICNHTLAGSTGYAVNTITNCGTLTIEDATIENKSTAQYQIGYAIDNNSTSADAVVNIKGGKVIASGSLYYDGIRQFCNSQTKENSIVVNGGEVSTIWMQNPSDGGTKNTKDVKGSIAISGGKVGVLSLEPSANFEAAVTGGHFGEISYFQTAEGRDLKGFITGGTFYNLIDETFLAMGYQLTGDAAPYTVAYTGEVTELVLVDGEVTEFVNEKEITVGTLTYKRSNIKNTWTPFYVPFAVPVSALADKFDVAYINDVRRTDSDDDGELDKFSMEIIYIHGGNANGSAKTLKANYPYFIRSKSGVAEMEIALTDAKLYAAKENVFDCTTMTEKFEIKGNYHQILAEELDSKNDYVVGGGEWHHLETGKDYSLNPFRFYMTRSSRDGSDPTTMAPMKSMKIVVCGEEDENGATIIYDVVEDSLNNNGNDFIYDLQGRRVSEPKKGGIYIKNGKKILF